jgi:hypothetical protein
MQHPTSYLHELCQKEAHFGKPVLNAIIICETKINFHYRTARQPNFQIVSYVKMTQGRFPIIVSETLT